MKQTQAPLIGEVMPAGEWTLDQAEAHILAAWQNAVEGIIETGRRLNEAKDRVGHGKWLSLVERMPWGKRTVQRLMVIAQHPDLANAAHASHLPASWYTLSVLAQFPPGELPRLIKSGEITPDLERAKAQEMAAEYNAGRQALLTAYSRLVDNVTAALSSSDTVRPPDDLPDNYVSVEHLEGRVTRLLENVRNWRKS